MSPRETRFFYSVTKASTSRSRAGLAPRLISLLLVLMWVLGSTCHTANGQEEWSSVRRDLAEAFLLVQDAEEAGGDVSELVASLNMALELANEGEASSDPTRADELFVQTRGIVASVKEGAPRVKEAGAIAQKNAMTILAADLATLGLLGLASYLYIPRFFWRLWLRSHGDWRLRARG